MKTPGRIQSSSLTAKKNLLRMQRSLKGGNVSTHHSVNQSHGQRSDPYMMSKVPVTGYGRISQLIELNRRASVDGTLVQSQSDLNIMAH